MIPLTVDRVLNAMRLDGRFYKSPRVGRRIGIPTKLWRRTDRGTFALVSATWLRRWIAEQVAPDVPTDLVAVVLASALEEFPLLTDDIAGVPISWSDGLRRVSPLIRRPSKADTPISGFTLKVTDGVQRSS